MQVGQAKNFKLENIEVAQVKDLIHDTWCFVIQVKQIPSFLA